MLLFIESRNGVNRLEAVPMPLILPPLGRGDLPADHLLDRVLFAAYDLDLGRGGEGLLDLCAGDDKG